MLYYNFYYFRAPTDLQVNYRRAVAYDLELPTEIEELPIEIPDQLPEIIPVSRPVRNPVFIVIYHILIFVTLSVPLYFIFRSSKDAN